MPRDTTAKGMFFTMVQRELKRANRHDQVPAAAQGYRHFHNYPYADLLRLEVAACRALYPSLPLREGLRRLGKLVFPMFLDQMIGRVIFGVVGRDPRRVLQLSAKGYAVAASTGTANPVEVSPDCGVLELRAVPNFPSAFHVGVVEGTLHHLGVTAEVDVVEHGLFDVDIRACWR